MHGILCFDKHKGIGCLGDRQAHHKLELIEGDRYLSLRRLLDHEGVPRVGLVGLYGDLHLLPDLSGAVFGYCHLELYGAHALL
jgi:hypothetical protein